MTARNFVRISCGKQTLTSFSSQTHIFYDITTVSGRFFKIKNYLPSSGNAGLPLKLKDISWRQPSFSKMLQRAEKTPNKPLHPSLASCAEIRSSSSVPVNWLWNRKRTCFGKCPVRYLTCSPASALPAHYFWKGHCAPAVQSAAPG